MIDVADSNFILPILTALIGILGVIIGGRYSLRTNQQETSRIIFEKTYHPIFKIIEDKFYKKDLSDYEITKLGREIYQILDDSKGYYYPSLKQYSSQMFSPDYKGDLNELWNSFCWSFDKEYSRVSKEIGLPQRSRYYRLNMRQYENKFQLIKIYVFSKYVIYDLLLIFIMIFLIYLSFIYSSV